VFELLGESDRARRKALVNRLYEETARHFRQIRVVEIQKMEQRAKTAARRFTAEELAADAWDAIYLKDSPSIVQLLSSQSGPKVLVAVPAEGAPRLVDENSMFDREVVFFGAGRKAGRVVCASRAQAELLGRLATLGIRGDVAVPESENLCHELRATIDAQLETARNQIVSIPATLRQPVKTLQRFRCTRNYERHTAVPAANDSFSLGLTACLACSNTAAKAGDSLVSIGAHDGCRTKVQL